MTGNTERFAQEMKLVDTELEKLEELFDKADAFHGSLIDRKELAGADKDLRRLSSSLRVLAADYRKLQTTIASLEEEQRDLVKSGKAITDQQKEQLTTLRTTARERRGQMATVSARSLDVEVRRGQMREQKTLYERATSFAEGSKARSFGGSLLRGGQRMGGWGANLLSVGMGQGQALASGLSAIPILGPILGMVANVGMQQYALGRDVFLKNTMSRMAARQSGLSSKFIGRASSMGLPLGHSQAETLGMMRDYGRATGGHDRHMDGFEQSLQMARGYNLDPSTIHGLLQATRQGGGLQGETSRSVQEALVSAIESNTFSRALASELATASTGLIQQYAQAGATVSARQVLGMVTLLGQKLGGTYKESPEKTVGLLGKVNTAFQGAFTSGDDSTKAAFQEALLLGGFKGSQLDLEKQAEKGAIPENVRGILLASRRRGKNQLAREKYLSHLLGIPLTQAGHLAGLDPNQITQEGINKSLALTDPRKTIVDQSKSAMSEADLLIRQKRLDEKRADLARGADPFVAKMEEMQMKAIGELGKVASKLDGLFTNPGATMKQMATEVGTMIGNTIADVLRQTLPKFLSDRLVGPASPPDRRGALGMPGPKR